MFNLPDFPSENYGKQKVVELTALINWYQQKIDEKIVGKIILTDEIKRDAKSTDYVQTITCLSRRLFIPERLPQRVC